MKDLYLFEKLERVEGKGMLVFYDGALYPARGFPTDPSSDAVNFIKRTLRESLKFPLIFAYSNKRLIDSFNEIASNSIGRAFHPGYIICPAAAKIQKIVETFLIEIGIDHQAAKDCAKYIGFIFENDNAYRYRVQDMATEAMVEAFIDNPRKEFERVLNIYIEREGGHTVVINKFKLFAKFISFSLLFPKYKRAFKKAIAHGLDGLKYDREDWYWVSHRTDYKFGGMTHEQRYKEFDIHPKLYTLEELQSMVK